jgi:putative hemin transport protein
MNALVNFHTTGTGLSGLLYKALQGVRQAQPHGQLKDWARLLNASEGELQAARIGHEDVCPLRDVFSVFYQLSFLGEVAVTAYNALGQVQHRGCFSAPDLCLDNPHQLGIQFLTSGLHLKLRLEHWYWGCAADDKLEFFTRQGQLFMTIRKTPATDESAWQELLSQYAEGSVSHKPLFEQPHHHPAEHPMPQDLQLLEKEWRNMAGPEQLPQLLKRQHTTYFAALCCLGPKLARSGSLDSFEQLLQQAAQVQLPLSLSMISPGCVQTCRQAVITPRLEQSKLELLWPQGRAQLDPGQFEFAFVTRKPSKDAWISALEIFGAQGDMLLQIQGATPPGKPENLRLRELMNSLR